MGSLLACLTTPAALAVEEAALTCALREACAYCGHRFADAAPEPLSPTLVGRQSPQDPALDAPLVRKHRHKAYLRPRVAALQLAHPPRHVHRAADLAQPALAVAQKVQVGAVRSRHFIVGPRNALS